MRPWLLLLVPAPAWAATLAVPGAYPTIQSAVNAANNGDRIEVQPGVSAEEVTIDVDANVVLSGFTLLADERSSTSRTAAWTPWIS
jgi:pectin methylesterase-like acyl-CoA thioesterase